MNHICTEESLLVGALEGQGICPICNREGKHRVGYISTHCSVCNQYYDNEGWMGYAVYKRRVALKMKRRDFAALLGIKRKTLANCETSRCSKRVYDKSLEVFTELFIYPSNLGTGTQK